MNRTQIYLSEEETSALDRLAKKTGRSRSQLIREAIAGQYLARIDAGGVVSVLRATAGSWRGRRQSGAAIVERLRRGRLAKIHRKLA